MCFEVVQCYQELTEQGNWQLRVYGDTVMGSASNNGSDND